MLQFGLLRRLALGGISMAMVTTSLAQPEVRGQLLYSAHCVECHTTQMHWRENRQARDWYTLKAQVRRWQGTSGLGWSEEDINDVARHLNRTIYKFPQPEERASASASLVEATSLK